MKSRLSIRALHSVALLVLLLPFSLAQAADNAAIKKAIAGEHRLAEFKARDKYRNPRQTLNFFDIKATDTVVEIWPGSKGWYTEILAPLLRRKGLLIAAHWAADSSSSFYSKSRQQFDDKLALNPLVYNKVQVTLLEPPQQVDIAPAGSADKVLTFRNVHNWMKSGTDDEVFAAMYKALKPGGLLGVVEHRAKSGKTKADMISSGYVTEAYVREAAEKAGFQFVQSAEFNANARDTHDHPRGVWSLPPSLRLGQQGREYYLGIGESDRMTLKFRKPK